MTLSPLCLCALCFAKQVEWTIPEVLDFLETCRVKLGSKVDQYKQIMVENDVDGEVFVDMTDELLQRSALCFLLPVIL